MKKIFFLITLSIAGNFSISLAQNDAKAKKILDELSAKTKTYTSMGAEFSYKIENKVQKTNETQEGKIFLKGSKYKLEIPGQIIINDASTVWTILKDANEVQINNATASSKEDAVNPSNIFTLYEKGFKYEFVKEETQKNGTVYQIIKLFPSEPGKKNFHTILLTIDKSQKQIISLKIMGKDGTDITYTVKKFTPNAEFADTFFSFNSRNYPGYEVIDLRD